MANGSNDIYIEEWMIKDLQITGTEVMCFAVVYCYSKNGGSYYGGLPSLAERLGMPEVTLGRVIKRLVAKGFLHCTHISNGGRQYCDLRAMKTPSSKRQVTPIKMIGDTHQNDRCTPSKRQVAPIEMIDKYNNKYNKENNKDNKESNDSSIATAKRKSSIDYEEFKDFYNMTMDEAGAIIPRIDRITPKRKGMINARVKEYGMDAVREVVRKSATSTYMNGAGRNGWVASFDWIFSPNNFVKIFENNYNDNKPNNNGRDNIRRGVWPTPAENATRAEEWATNRILELTQPKDKGIQGEISDNRDTDKLFLPF